MSKVLNKNEVIGFPLLRDFDFNGIVYTPGEISLLTSENREFYEKINIWKGKLSIIPILQKRFNNNDGISVRELNEEIKKDSRLEKFLSGVNGRPSPIHYSFLQLYEEEGIAWCKRDVNSQRPIFFDEDYFFEGALYSTTRVMIE